MTAVILPIHPAPEQPAPKTPARRDKPAKPYKDFPLFPHATGRWAKKIRGRMYYFGPWDNPKQALEKYLDQKDDLHAGRIPRVQSEGLTVRELCIKFLTLKKTMQEAGELKPRSYEDCAKTCERITAAFGRTRLAADLHPDDFLKLRASWRTWGPRTVSNEINRVRGVFKFGYDAGLLQNPVRYGPGFKRPSQKTLRLHRAAKVPQMFDRKEIRTMLKRASRPLKAMILLAINGGFGNEDCAALRVSLLDLLFGWITYPRPKTGVERRVPLWPETVVAIREALNSRPKPGDATDADLLFVTRCGHAWNKDRATITHEFGKLCVRANIAEGRSFYALRHTFRTIADEMKDQPAIDRVMGHAPKANDMAAHYREQIDDGRLQAVAEHVRRWLFQHKPRK